jgi:hypothetical protein
MNDSPQMASGLFPAAAALFLRPFRAGAIREPTSLTAVNSTRVDANVKRGRVKTNIRSLLNKN